MATISTADFRNGMGLKINDKYYTIVEFQHVKPGKGGAFVRYKIRDLKSGRVIDQTCNAGTKFENVQLITKEMQYLYNDGESYYFWTTRPMTRLPFPLILLARRVFGSKRMIRASFFTLTPSFLR